MTSLWSKSSSRATAGGTAQTPYKQAVTCHPHSQDRLVEHCEKAGIGAERKYVLTCTPQPGGRILQQYQTGVKGQSRGGAGVSATCPIGHPSNRCFPVGSIVSHRVRYDVCCRMTAGTTLALNDPLTRSHPFFAAPTAMTCVLETMKRHRSLTRSGAVMKTVRRACNKSHVMSALQLQGVVLLSNNETLSEKDTCFY